MKKKDICIECYRIICGGCGWEPTPEEVLLVQDGSMTTCPDCGWSPAMN